MHPTWAGDLFHALQLDIFKIDSWDFPGGPVVKNPPANDEDTGSITGPGRSHMLWYN